MITEQNNTSNIEQDEISLKELIQKVQEWFGYLKTQWKLIFSIAAIGAIIGFTCASFQKYTYKAALTFALEEEKGGGLGGAMGLASSFGIDLGASAGGAFSGSNLIELMKSRKLVEKTLLSPIEIEGKTISLADYFIHFSKLNKGWSEKSTMKNVNFPINADKSKFTLQHDSILKQLYLGLVKNNLTISQKDKKVSIISIEVKSENELFSKIFTETLAKETSDYYVEIKSKKAKTNVEILQHQADSIRLELNNAITGVASATDNVFNLNSAMNVKRTNSAKKQVDVQANTAILTQLVTQLELAKVSLRKETPLLQVIDAPILPLEKEKLGRIKSFVLGGFLAGFLAVLYLVFGRLYKNLVA